MDFANHPYREGFVVDEGNCSTDVTATRPPRKSSLANNFSYPRPEGSARRHESSDSRCSLASNDSMPGMTDSSDSETSFDEDSSYNASASELWDSFWPDSTIVPGEQYPVLLRASQTPNYFTKSFPKHESQGADDTIVISNLEPNTKKASSPSCETPVPQPSPPRPVTRNGPHSYSVYPKVEPANLLRIPLPPRTSSLNTVPLSPPRRQAPKSTKTHLHLKSSKSSHSLRPHYAVPTVSKVPMPSTAAKSVPVSPAYPPPPPPTTLRLATSALELNNRKNSLSQIHHYAAEPLSPLSLAPPVDETQSTPRPQPERFVSVFEVDSDHESYTESTSITKRIARGFHKKSASEKRINGDRRGSADSESDKDKGKESPSRKRGGSLGRILGLKGR
ncbi:hypothetical protein F4804DRAFT_78566 [Jackrogersella minutella]|nr:hypothetical protein F4804DRAFT_78566 [Jackrogersella minutella]